MKKRIAILGSAISGGALQVIDAILTTRDLVAVAVYDSDVNSHGIKILNVPVLGSTTECLDGFNRSIFDFAVVAVGGSTLQRKKVFESLKKENIPTENIVSPQAIVSPSAAMGSGNVILPSVYIGPNVTIHDNCYFISGTTINHHTVVHNHSYFSTGVSIASHVTVGEGCRFDTASFAVSRKVLRPFSVIQAGETVEPEK